ncbi:MAG: hypothetical protein J7M24_00250 [Candidatus Latescibacteria bacterium]|nr:hypothetical protein [Candidatus Latescibacterota bacterium]
MNEQSALILLAARRAVRDILDEWDIPCSDEDIEAVILPTAIRNVMIRAEYQAGNRADVKHGALHFELAQKYDVSERTVRRIVGKEGMIKKPRRRPEPFSLC